MSTTPKGYLALVLHAHLPYIRHPEQERFLEESWLFEAVAECYLPLLKVFDGWSRDSMPWRLTITLSPTLCAMLRDPLLQDRCGQYLDRLVELAGKECMRTRWDKSFQPLAHHYQQRFASLRDAYHACDRDLVAAFARHQTEGHLEIITTAATHALLPLVASHPPSLRAQIHVGRDSYRQHFGIDPRGFWLPECAYAEGMDEELQKAGLRWFITDTHGLLHARPKPRYGVFAPIFTPHGVAAFARDLDSSRQVWSKEIGYPGDPRYRDFYRDIGHDLDLDYVRPYMATPEARSFTGIKYHAITGVGEDKRVYDRGAALQAAADHAAHFLDQRMQHVDQLAAIMERPPILLAPYDAELFGHWWFEGPEFLDMLVRKIVYDQNTIALVTPWQHLHEHPTQQVAEPSASSWGEEGYYSMWLNESNQWIYPHLRVAQDRMTELVRTHPNPKNLTLRALQQAARELLLAQSSDWPFILRTGTHPEYAKARVTDHLVRFIALHEQLTTTHVDGFWLDRVQASDNLFTDIDVNYWG